VSDRLADRFAALSGRAALVTFLVGGDPAPALTEPLLHALVRGGADIIEIGMPFTDPMADGPAIQAGNIRALESGITLAKILGIVAGFRAADAQTPLILMGYLNPILAFGVEAFAAAAKVAGLDGLILVDLPPEEAGEVAPHLGAHGLQTLDGVGLRESARGESLHTRARGEGVGGARWLVL
jgi:tryptophan synthase alpha chain